MEGELPNRKTENLSAETIEKYFRAADYLIGADLALELTREEPSCEGAYYWGVLCALYGAKFDSVCELGMRALRSGVQNTLVLNALGNAYWQLGLYDFSKISHMRCYNNDKNNTANIFGLCRAMVRCGDLQDAIDLAGSLGENLGSERQQAFGLNVEEEMLLEGSNWSYGLYQSGLAAFRREAWDLAVSRLFRAFHIFLTKNDPEMLNICGEYLCNSKICSVSSKDGLAEIADLAMDVLPEARWPHIYRGAGKIFGGKATEGICDIVKAQALPEKGLPDALGANSLLSLEQMQEALSRPSALVYDEIEIDLPAMQRVVILVACDGIYFEKLSNLYVGSLNRFNEICSVHFHIMNPGEKTNQILLMLKRKYSNVKITVSYEFIDKKTENLKAIYATRRFFIAKSIIHKYNIPVLVTDMDISFESPAHRFLAQLGDADFGLMFEGRILPWFSNPATIIYFSTSVKSINFLNCIIAYIEYSFTNFSASNIWFVDQNAIFVSRNIQLSAEPEIANLNAIKPGLFGCYTTEGRDVYTDRRSHELGLFD